MDLYLARLGLEDTSWLDPATAASIVLISLITAFVFHKLLFPLIIRATRWTPTDLDSRILRAVPLAADCGTDGFGGIPGICYSL